LKKILQKEGFDLVITNNLKGIGLLTPRLLKKLKIKHVHILHDIQLIYPSGLMLYGEEKKVEGFFSKIYSFFLSFIFHSPDVVISPSNWLLDFHVRKNFFKFSKKIVLPNPTKIEIGEQKKDSHIFRFIFVGQIENYKGYSILVDAFKKLNNSNSELVIIGNGTKMGDLRKMAEGFEKIKIMGKIKREEVFDLMKGSDYLIVPSLCYENSPTVIYEAASVGLPVIASRIGGIPELVEKFGGILFEPGNEKDLIDKMREVYYNINKVEMKEMGDSCVQQYVERLLNC